MLLHSHTYGFLSRRAVTKASVRLICSLKESRGSRSLQESNQTETIRQPGTNTGSVYLHPISELASIQDEEFGQVVRVLQKCTYTD